MTQHDPAVIAGGGKFRSPHHVARMRCVPLLLALVAAHAPFTATGFSAETTAVGDQVGGVPLIIAGLNDLDAEGVAAATSGIAVAMGERLAMADAGRFDQRTGDLYLTGRVVFRQPGVRLAVDRLGLRVPPGQRTNIDPSTITGDAWQIDATITVPITADLPQPQRERTLRIRAERASIAAGVITFHDVELDLGHGGILSFSAPRVRVLLRQPKPGEPPRELRSNVEGVELLSPTGEIVGLPVLWVPWLYRDFSRRYPWTRVRGGYERRLGTYGRFWIGSDLPEFWGISPGLDLRVDDHSRAGWGFGVRPYWRGVLGRGDAEGYLQTSEAVRGNAPGSSGERDELTVRRTLAIDAHHQASIGAGGMYGRFTKLPPPDPLAPGSTSATGPVDYRWMQDYLPERLENDPFPRRGATGAYTLGPATLVADIERRVHPLHRTTERWFGVQGLLHPLQIAGPLHLGADTWVEDLHRVDDDSTTTRLTSRGYLMMGQWFPGGMGVDALGGVKESRSAVGEIAGVDTAAASRRAAFSLANVKLRLDRRWGGGLTHTVVPRVGIDVTGTGAGDALPDYGFGDGRSVFAEDERYWVTAVGTDLVADRTLFHADLAARWAMRRLDRRYTDRSGTVNEGPTALADVTGRLDGSPISSVNATASGTWDARPREWASFNGLIRWRAATVLGLSTSTTYIPDNQTWSHTPTISLYANRYRFDESVTFRPGGAAIDEWQVEILRSMVDGDLSVGFAFLRDRDGVVSDRRISVGFTLGATRSNDVDDTEPRARTGFSY